MRGNVFPAHRIYITTTCEEATKQGYLRSDWRRIDYLIGPTSNLFRTMQTAIAGWQRPQFPKPLLQFLPFAFEPSQSGADLGNFTVRFYDLKF